MISKKSSPKRFFSTMCKDRGIWQKSCTVCQTFKTLDQFYKDRNGRPGSWCRDCIQAYQRRRYRTRKDNETSVCQVCKARSNIQIGFNGCYVRTCAPCGIRYIQQLEEQSHV
jgi:hypothetical protein